MQERLSNTQETGKQDWKMNTMEDENEHLWAYILHSTATVIQNKKASLLVPSQDFQNLYCSYLSTHSSYTIMPTIIKVKNAAE